MSLEDVLLLVKFLFLLDEIELGDKGSIMHALYLWTFVTERITVSYLVCCQL